MILFLLFLALPAHAKAHSDAYYDGYRQGCITAQNSSNGADDEILARCMESLPDEP